MTAILPPANLGLLGGGQLGRFFVQAARELEKQGVSAEVIDVATLNPIDHDTILASVEKTGRCVIVQEAARTCSVSAEIVSRR